MCQPVHIALFGDFRVSGGAYRTLVNQIKIWVAEGIQVELVGYRKATPFFPDELPEAVSFVHLGTRSKLLTTIALWLYLRRRRPAVIYAATHIDNLILVRASGLPGVVTRVWLSVHNNYVRSGKRTDPKSQNRKLAQVRRQYAKAEGVIAVSEGVRRDLTETLGLSAGKVHTAYNAVLDPSIVQRSKESVDHPWFKDNTGIPVVISVGRLARQKDYPTLLRAFARLRLQRPLRLIILGEGKERQALEAMVREMGLQEVVQLPGYVDNPYAWLRQSDLFVLSSAWEGFGNVLAEALGLGLPVVSTNCPSGPSEILQDGRYGELVPVGDDEALAASMVKVLDGHGPEVDAHAATAPYWSDASARRYLALFGLPSLAGLEGVS